MCGRVLEPDLAVGQGYDIHVMQDSFTDDRHSIDQRLVHGAAVQESHVFFLVDLDDAVFARDQWVLNRDVAFWRSANIKVIGKYGDKKNVKGGGNICTTGGSCRFFLVRGVAL